MREFEVGQKVRTPLGETGTVARVFFGGDPIRVKVAEDRYIDHRAAELVPLEGVSRDVEG